MYIVRNKNFFIFFLIFGTCPILVSLIQYFLNINLNKDWSENKKRSVVDTKILGKAKITNQFFEDRNGEKITINNDYHGKLRNQNNPMPGPFSFKESLNKLKVWPK